MPTESDREMGPEVGMSLDPVLVPVKGKSVPLQARGAQEVKVPRFRDNGTGWW